MLCYSHIGRDVIFNGDDMGFHLNRIEGIAQGIKNGLPFSKINYFFVYGMGYASPIFYSDRSLTTNFLMIRQIPFLSSQSV